MDQDRDWESCCPLLGWLSRTGRANRVAVVAAACTLLAFSFYLVAVHLPLAPRSQLHSLPVECLVTNQTTVFQQLGIDSETLLQKRSVRVATRDQASLQKRSVIPDEERDVIHDVTNKHRRDVTGERRDVINATRDAADVRSDALNDDSTVRPYQPNHKLIDKIAASGRIKTSMGVLGGVILAFWCLYGLAGPRWQTFSALVLIFCGISGTIIMFRALGVVPYDCYAVFDCLVLVMTSLGLSTLLHSVAAFCWVRCLVCHFTGLGNDFAHDHGGDNDDSRDWLAEMEGAAVRFPRYLRSGYSGV